MDPLLIGPVMGFVLGFSVATTIAVALRQYHEGDGLETDEVDTRPVRS